MLIDLGGLHSRKDASIDLNDVIAGPPTINVKETLGLENGGVYTLDIFHAERSTTASNFGITTTLFPACNIILSGTDSFNLETDELSLSQFRKKFTSIGVEYNVTSRSLFLQRESSGVTATSVFTTTQENVARGRTFRGLDNGPVNHEGMGSDECVVPSNESMFPGLRWIHDTNHRQM